MKFRNLGSRIVEIWFTYNVIEYKMTLYTQVTQNTHTKLFLFSFILLWLFHIYLMHLSFYQDIRLSKCPVYWRLIRVLILLFDSNTANRILHRLSYIESNVNPFIMSLISYKRTTLKWELFSDSSHFFKDIFSMCHV